MRIRGWVVTGFGHFNQHEIKGLGDGITVFLGPNEAGKSTLLAFLRGVLFGFPDRRNKEQQYAPLRGGKHGGVLILEDGNGRFSVEREAGKKRPPRVITDDGREETEQVLKSALGQADANLFRSIFAFSLTELYSFETLSAEGVRDRIFSAGIAGAGQCARQVIARLNEEAQEIFKPRGDSLIGRLMEELEQAQEWLKQAKVAAQGYKELLRDEERWGFKGQDLKGQIETLRRRSSRVQLLLEQWPFWCEHQQLKRELSQLEVVPKFPQDAESGLIAALEACKLTANQASQLSKECEDQAAKINGLEEQLDDGLASIMPSIETHYQSVGLYRDSREQVTQTGMQIIQAEFNFSEKLREIGLSAEAVENGSVDTSLPGQEQVREWDRLLHEAGAAVKNEEASLVAANRERQKAEREHGRLLLEVQSSTGKDTEELDEKESALRSLRSKLSELRELEARIETRAELLQERDDGYTQGAGDAGLQMPGWLFPVGLIIASSVIAIGFWRLASGDAVSGIALLVIGVFVAVFTILLKSWFGKIVARPSEEMKQLPALAGQRKEIERLGQQTGKLKQAITEGAALLELSPLPSGEEIELASAKLASERRSASRREELGFELERAKRVLADASAEESRIEARVIALRSHEQQKHTAWLEWKSTAGVPETLTCQGVLDFFRELNRARELQQAREDVELKMNSLLRYVHGWEGESRRLLEAAGKAINTDANGDTLVLELKLLLDACKAENGMRQRIAAARQALEDLERRREIAEDDRRAAQRIRDVMFEEVGASDEGEYRYKLETFRKRQHIERLIIERDTHLLARIGQDTEADLIKGELAGGRLEDWKIEFENNSARINELESERDETIKSFKEISLLRESLEKAVDVPTVEAEIQGIKNEMESYMKKWVDLTLARELIEKTLQKYREHKQPTVLSDASRILRTVTGGHYERVIQEDEENSLAVMDKNGNKKRPEELSRGTAEQLYVSLRLGLASAFAKSSSSLPFIMDDVFVNFDPERAEGMARAIAEFAKEHQVLIFTCHPQTAELMQKADSQATVINLARHAMPAIQETRVP